ncbi:hypothetical protein [Halorubellus salinus]|uniref:hypothetical protein n=1 Tax=Halorubellus salinus TaxID=755309 RepID=UPI001D07971F|nr:hypothetical protein [Halorubellus salinus]
MSAEDAVLDYYEALRRGEPLYPYFRESPDTWKAAISTTYDGYDAVAAALREQTRTTTDWSVGSDGPAVVQGEEWASFNDAVSLAWTRTSDDDDATATRHEFETRWSGTLVDHDDEWSFLELHVSAPTAV